MPLEGALSSAKCEIFFVRLRRRPILFLFQLLGKAEWFSNDYTCAIKNSS